MTRVSIINREAGIVEATPPAHEVILAACGMAFPEKEGREIWGLNAWNPRALTTATRWFQLHPLGILPKDERRWLRACPVPCYTLRYHPTMAHTVKYPKDDVPVGPFTSTFDWMMALAIAEDFAEIIVTADMQNGTARERIVENAGLAYWIGYARGRGITVRVLGETARYPHLYGAEYWTEARWVSRYCREVVADAMRLRLDDGQAEGRRWSHR